MDDDEIPLEEFDSGWPSYLLPSGLDRWTLRVLAGRWGVPEGEVVRHGYRRRPCVDCGHLNPFRCDLTRCDPCFLRRCVKRLREAERARRAMEWRRQRRAEAQHLLATMSPGRRQLVELSGIAVDDPQAVYAEAYGE